VHCHLITSLRILSNAPFHIHKSKIKFVTFSLMSPAAVLLHQWFIKPNWMSICRLCSNILCTTFIARATVSSIWTALHGVALILVNFRFSGIHFSFNRPLHKSVRNTFCGTWYLPHSFGDSAVNKSKIPIFYIAHALNGHISTSGQKSDVITVFPDQNFGDS